MERRAGSWLGRAGLVALLPLLAGGPAGCRLGISTQVEYRPEPRASRPEAAAKKNGLVLGIRRLELRGPQGAEPDPEAGDADELGRLLAEAIKDLLLFEAVHYPLRDEAVDVVLEPVLEVDLSKNRLTNALSVFPGLVLPWIDGFGLDYDHHAVLLLRVRNPRRQGVVCDTFTARSDMLAERYPSVLWWLGLHAGLLVLLVTESVSTDHLVLERLIERNVTVTVYEGVHWLKRELTAEPKPCVLHPEAPIAPGQRYCIVCRRDLWFPILNRTEGRDEGAPPPGSP
ncbi:MAG: hypothetical protein KatS3mg102_1929 [Planctomycetota bacterium]|nr:MAG: hypothetical protein KatS3mg102_1929 [Planctomycetota bacterium]